MSALHPTGQKRDIRQVNASLKAHKWPLLGQMH
jgi:hypothetical protein